MIICIQRAIRLWIFKVINNFAKKVLFLCSFYHKILPVKHLDPNTGSVGKCITPLLIVSTQSHIQLVLNEVWTSFTVSQETPPGRGQAPHWRKLIIGHQLWSIILVNLSTTASIKSLMKQLHCWQFLLQSTHTYTEESPGIPQSA